MPSTGTISRLMHKAMAVVTLSSAVLSFAVILLSWLGSVLWRGDIVSLLTPRGMRWIVGSCADMLATDVVVWLLLLGLAYGVTVRSGWAEALFANASLLLTPKARRPAVAAATTYIERVSFRISVAVLLVRFYLYKFRHMADDKRFKFSDIFCVSTTCGYLVCICNSLFTLQCGKVTFLADVRVVII